MAPVALFAVALGLVAPEVLAHAPETAPAAPSPWRWNFEPWVVAMAAVALLLYVAGVARLWQQAGRGRGISEAQCASFVGGWLAAMAALVSPLDALGAQLFSAHMLQHELLMLMAAPLLVLGRPLAAWTWALRPSLRRRVAGVIRWRWLEFAWDLFTRPVSAWALHAIALWAWHIPPFFEAALKSEGLHIFQHASFFVTALLFWWAVLGSDARSKTSAFAMVYLFTTMMHTSALGALLTLAPTVWYPQYAASGGAFGLDPVEDQELGGLLMWVPGAFAYVAAALAVMARLLAPTLRRPQAKGQ